MSIDGQTQLVGIIGKPLAHSLSPEIHNAAFAYMGLNWRYVPLPVQDSSELSRALQGLGVLGFRGVNVTVPYKVDVIPLLNRITDAVSIVGAVNTIRVDRQTGLLEGLNTDMTGFLADVAAHKISLGKNSRVVILGAGGGARAVCAGLLRCGAQVIIVNRSQANAANFIRFMRASWAESNVDVASYNDLQAVSKNATLIVNCTPLGMWPEVDNSPWPANVPFPKTAIVYDTVYRPWKTKLCRDAEAAGLRTINGAGMLVYQGAASFEAWTGQKPPIDVMKMMCQQKLQDK